MAAPAEITDIIPFNEFGSLDDLDFLENRVFDTESQVLRAPELDDLSGVVEDVLARTHKRAYLGLEAHDDCLALAPRLPPELRALRLSIRYRSLALELQVDHTHLRVAADGGKGKITLNVGGKGYAIEPGDVRTIAL